MSNLSAIPAKGLRRRRRVSRTGSVLVESVVGVILLCTFGFGIAELALECKDSAAMYNYARDCARDLISDSTMTSAVNKAVNAANSTGSFTTAITSGNFNIWYSTSSTFTTKIAVEDSGVSNNIPPNSYVMVDLAYSHSRVTDLFGTGATTMHAIVIMYRR